jgi:hypothetical protein
MSSSLGAFDTTSSSKLSDGNKQISEARAMLQRSTCPEDRQGLRRLFPAMPRPWQQMTVLKLHRRPTRGVKIVYRLLLLHLGQIALQNIGYQF